MIGIRQSVNPTMRRPNAWKHPRCCFCLFHESGQGKDLPRLDGDSSNSGGMVWDGVGSASHDVCEVLELPAGLAFRR
jgi:hypothetical protein